VDNPEIYIHPNAPQGVTPSELRNDVQYSAWEN